MSDFPNLTVVDHPLIGNKLGLLRSVDTPTKLFRKLVEEIAMLMAYEVTCTLEEEEVEVVTPLETMTGHRIPCRKLVVVPVLRAGLGMVEGVMGLIPSARVGHVGLARDVDEFVDGEVGPHRTHTGADEVALVCLVTVQRDPILVAVDRHRPQTQLGACAKYADGDLSAVGDQDATEHLGGRRRSATEAGAIPSVPGRRLETRPVRP